jgi:hypothetical protein
MGMSRPPLSLPRTVEHGFYVWIPLPAASGEYRAVLQATSAPNAHNEQPTGMCHHQRAPAQSSWGGAQQLGVPEGVLKQQSQRTGGESDDERAEKLVLKAGTQPSGDFTPERHGSVFSYEVLSFYALHSSPML